MRHPCDRGFFTRWQKQLRAYWLRGTAKRRHASGPFNKRNRGRRVERRWRIENKNDWLIQ